MLKTGTNYHGSPSEIEMEFIDNYEHIDPRVIYTRENVPTKDTEDDFLEITRGCKCPNECRIETNCACIGKRSNYEFDSFENNLENIQDNYTLVEKHRPVYECNSYCKCSSFCTNRLVQFGPRKYLRVAPCKRRKTICSELGLAEKPEPGKGLGIFTMQIIYEGNFVCEYAGEIISQMEANRRFVLQERRKLPNYIFCLNENFGERAVTTLVDPSQFGNIGRYINHSCNPNCEVVPVRVYCTVPKLCVFAKRNIQPEAEITFDYGSTDNPDDLSANQNRKSCLCGFMNCRKFLPFHLTK